jgi:gamma-glutamylcyclotransferase (GGCT)/AIG2-like uncharacterized protein YtfP
MARLFVYGSLKCGFRHHDVLAGAVFVRAAATAPGYRLVLLGEYPALTADPSGHRIQGELFEVGEALWPERDRVEGCPELYQRAAVLLDDGSTAQSYVISTERAAGLPHVRGALWVKR